MNVLSTALLDSKLIVGFWPECRQAYSCDCYSHIFRSK